MYLTFKVSCFKLCFFLESDRHNFPLRLQMDKHEKTMKKYFLECCANKV